MVFFKVTVLLATALAFASALPQYDAPAPAPATGGYGGQGQGDGASSSPASYSFTYENQDPDSGNYYGHAEQREGAGTSGEYRVLLPDGRTQIVKYTVEGEDGYRAVLSYEQPEGGAAVVTGGGGGGGAGGYQAPATGGYQ